MKLNTSIYASIFSFSIFTTAALAQSYTETREVAAASAVSGEVLLNDAPDDGNWLSDYEWMDSVASGNAYAWQDSSVYAGVNGSFDASSSGASSAVSATTTTYTASSSYTASVEYYPEVTFSSGSASGFHIEVDDLTTSTVAYDLEVDIPFGDEDWYYDSYPVTAGHEYRISVQVETSSITDGGAYSHLDVEVGSPE